MGLLGQAWVWIVLLTVVAADRGLARRRGWDGSGAGVVKRAGDIGRR